LSYRDNRQTNKSKNFASVDEVNMAQMLSAKLYKCHLVHATADDRTSCIECFFTSHPVVRRTTEV